MKSVINLNQEHIFYSRIDGMFKGNLYFINESVYTKITTNWRELFKI